MSEPKPAGSKRPRGKYSRLICLGCRERRIRCELPSEVEIPQPGEQRTLQTPCYRCQRLKVPCVIRQTILGRPGPKITFVNNTAANSWPTENSDVVPRIIINIPHLPTRTVARNQPATLRDETQIVHKPVSHSAKLHSSSDLLPRQAYPVRWDGDALLIHNPRSTESVIIIHALDTLRYEHVEEEWFRHLPARVGYTQALDLSVKAIVAACAYARGVPKLTSSDCYQALALAFKAVQANIKQSHGKPNDDMLASTALLAPFEGVVEKNGIPTRLHVGGLAAILAARPAAYPVTQLAREILDFNACESAIMACIQDTPSPFESIPRAYFANNRIGYKDSDQAQLKALGNQLFTGLPRLVMLARSLRLRLAPQKQLLADAHRLSKSLSKLQDSGSEGRLLRTVEVRSSDGLDATLPLHQSLYFASVKDFEALAYYWQSRLSLLRLKQCMHKLALLIDAQADKPGVCFVSDFGPSADEKLQLVKNILMCFEYARTLKLHKHSRLFAHAIVLVWGAAMDMPVGISHSQGGQRIDHLSDLLLREVNIALAAKPDLNVEDMDMAADIFIGGQPRGRFAELFGL